MCFKKKDEKDPSVLSVNKPLLIVCLCLLAAIVIIAIVIGTIKK